MRVRDADGDIWLLGADGDWWQVEYDSWLPSREVLALLFGPLSEVPE